MQTYPACKELLVSNMISSFQIISVSMNLFIWSLKRLGNTNCKWVWSENTTITNCRQTHGTARKSHETITRHHEDKLSKATSSFFTIKIIPLWSKPLKYWSWLYCSAHFCDVLLKYQGEHHLQADSAHEISSLIWFLREQQTLKNVVCFVALLGWTSE